MTDPEVPGRAPSVCAQCGTQVAPALLACPSCRRLVHAEDLKRLAATAERAEQAGDPSAALAAWRQALDLLPADATQQQVVSARIAALSRSLDAGPARAKTRGWDWPARSGDWALRSQPTWCIAPPASECGARSRTSEPG